MYPLVLGAAAVVSLALPLALVRRRASPGLVPFLLLVVAAAEWAGAAAFEHASVAPETKILFARLEYLGIAAVAPLWLAFVLGYTGSGAWLTRRRTVVLWLVPALTVVLAWTSDRHHLLWTTIVPRSPEPGAALVYGYGPWFWLAAAYSHALLLAGTVILLVALVRFPARYRGQTAALVAGLALPWVGNALYLGGWRVLEGRDPTPLAFALTGVVYTVGVFGFGLFDLVPLARHALVESLREGVLVVDAEGRVIDVNPAARDVLRLGEGPVIGASVAAVLAGWPEALARGRDAAGETELRVDDPGGPRVIALRVSLVRGAAGRERARVLVFSDVTARRRTEEALRENEKLASLARLLAGVAHELNNPLSVIVGHATLLGRRLPAGPAAERVAKIAAAAERCARIVHNFLAVAHQRKTERAPTDLNRALREAADFLAYQLQVDEVSVALHLGPTLPPAWADPQQIHQVAVNLLANAHQALRTAPPPRRITLSSWALPDGRRVAFSVADTGPGVPAAIRERIFEPFFTTKGIGDGSGLGLSVCRGLVEAHGGTLHVDSRPGAGATFTVTLPVADAPASGAAAPPPAPARVRRVLVVDDEPMVAEVLAEILGGQGHHVQTARDGREALAVLAAAPFDLVLADVKMPGLDGPGLYRALAARDTGPMPPVVFVSGDTLSAETRGFLAATGAPLLDKPFDADSVRRAVATALADT